ncbi:MAG: hypothetical protein O3A53_01620 [Acidobacteria bacterium]|nr:hypothetical protein [Acidobacteriota bacterium]MDA1233480.1 hypothetical protein [Acidobacteriota bacterium]
MTRDQVDSKEPIPGVLKTLQERGIPHRLILPGTDEDRELTDWMNSNLGFAGSQIQWSSASHFECEEWSDESSDALEAFRRAASSIVVESLVKVTWSDGACPTVEMRLKDAVSIGGELFEASFDTYVIRESERWILELHHEGTICWGFV